MIQVPRIISSSLLRAYRNGAARLKAPQIGSLLVCIPHDNSKVEGDELVIGEWDYTIDRNVYVCPVRVILTGGAIRYTAEMVPPPDPLFKLTYY